MRKLLIILPILLLAVGCSGLRKDFVKPEVKVVNLELDSVSVFETVMNFTVRIDNENPYPIELDGAKHQFYLNGDYIGKGFSRSKVEIPRLGSVRDNVEVHLSNLSVLGRVRSLLNAGDVAYSIRSTLYLDKSLGKRSIEINQDGSVPLAASL